MGYVFRFQIPPGALETKRPPTIHQVGGWCIQLESFAYPHSRVTSEIHFWNLDGTLASPSPGCRVRFNGQLLMLNFFLIYPSKNLKEIPVPGSARPGISGLLTTRRASANSLSAWKAGLPFSKRVIETRNPVRRGREVGCVFGAGYSFKRSGCHAAHDRGGTPYETVSEDSEGKSRFEMDQGNDR